MVFAEIMCAMRENNRNSLHINKFFVNKTASLFERNDETPREKRERSPCGVVEASERKMEVRRDKEKREEMRAKQKRQADPYAEQSSDDDVQGSPNIASGVDSNEIPNESRTCGHTNISVNINLVRKALKNKPVIGVCTDAQCQNVKSAPFDEENDYDPVIWMCLFCGHQGCDRNTEHQHALQHYRIPRSDSHCLILSTVTWSVWCYKCDSDVLPTSSKKLHEVVDYVKRQNDLATRTAPANDQKKASIDVNQTLTTTKELSQKSVSSKNIVNGDSSKQPLKPKLSTGTMKPSIPPVKGLNNLGNTCFFNSVMQSLTHTPLLKEMMETRCGSGHKMTLPGRSKPPGRKELPYRGKSPMRRHRNSKDEEADTEEELKPLELILSESGSLTLALASFYKDMHSTTKSSVINPGHIFGQICRKNAQFQGYHQEDAHELLRCLLDAIRSEENLRLKKAILKAFALSEKTDPNTVSPRLRNIIKVYGQQTPHCFVSEVFGGFLISTVICEECSRPSQVFDSFLDLSLPVVEEKGKPRKSTASDEEITSSSSQSLSKHQMKKQKKLDKKGGGKRTPKAGRREEEEDEEVKKRTTEKSRPEDHVTKEEEIEGSLGFQAGGVTEKEVKRGESFKFRQRMALQRKMKTKTGSASEEESEEEREYDQEDDEEQGKGEEENIGKGWMGRDGWEGVGTIRPKIQAVIQKDSRGKVLCQAERNCAESDSSSEISDADVEDNIESERLRRMYLSNTRQPSIIIDESTNDWPLEKSIVRDNRFLMTNYSADQNNSASDTSERYFTASEAKLCNGGHETELESGHIGSMLRGLLTVGKDEIQWPRSPLMSRKPSREGMDELCLKTQEELTFEAKNYSAELLAQTICHHSSRQGSTETGSESLTVDEDCERLKRGWARKLKQEWMARSLIILGERSDFKAQECSVTSCLSNFTAPELLTGSNKIICEHCSAQNRNETGDQTPVKCSASKQLLIVFAPAVLTLQLKRFHHVGYRLAKVNRFVMFPMVLDLAPYMSSVAWCLGNVQEGQKRVLYTLYAVVEHSGRLNSGHYVAYVRSRHPDKSRDTSSFLNRHSHKQLEVDSLVEEWVKARTVEEGERKEAQEQKRVLDLNLEELETEVKSGRWFHISDSYTAEVNVDRVMKSQAYLLFYERVL